MSSYELSQHMRFGFRVERRKRKLTRRLFGMLRYLSGKEGRKLVQYALMMTFIALAATVFGNIVAKRINQTYANVAYMLSSQIR